MVPRKLKVLCDSIINAIETTILHGELGCPKALLPSYSSTLEKAHVSKNYLCSPGDGVFYQVLAVQFYEVACSFSPCVKSCITIPKANLNGSIIEVS